jgi:flagellar protein FliS
MRGGANAYAKVGVETGVAAASPHKLVVMLFEGAMVAVASGIQHMQTGDVGKKGEAISKAINIIENGLRVSLDKKAGGEIALNLDALYEYMSSRLVTANLKNQTQTLEEVYQLLKGLKDAWTAIAPAEQAADDAPVASQPAARATAYDALAPRAAAHLVKA